MTNRAIAEPLPDPDGYPTLTLAPAPGQPAGALAWLAWATICLLWGTTFVAIRIAIETMPTLLVAAVRFLSAGAILLVVALLMRSRFPRGAAAWREQIVGGVLMAAVGNSLVVYAEHSLTSGLAALLAATIPIWMAVMESFFGLATMTPRKVAGLLIGFGGVALLVAPEIGRPGLSLPFLLAVGAMQLSAIAWNGGTLISRRHRDGGDPIAKAVVQMLAGGTAVAVVALASGLRPTAAMFSFRSTAAVLYLAVFGSVIAYSAYSYAQTRLSAGKISSYAYVNPAGAVVVGAALLGEPVTARMLVAMLLILAGVLTIQLGKTKIRAVGA
jgi:drug/metabolite transporter (DMT)-like permease